MEKIVIEKIHSIGIKKVIASNGEDLSDKSLKKNL